MFGAIPGLIAGYSQSAGLMQNAYAQGLQSGLQNANQAQEGSAAYALNEAALLHAYKDGNVKPGGIIKTDGEPWKAACKPGGLLEVTPRNCEMPKGGERCNLYGVWGTVGNNFAFIPDTEDSKVANESELLPDISLARVFKWGIVLLIALALGKKVWETFGSKITAKLHKEMELL